MAVGASRMEITEVSIIELQPRADARPVDEARLRELTASIEATGLIHPIRVRKQDFYYEVIAGWHRTVACRDLGWETIPCNVVDDDDLHAELAMIDENLIRASLSPVDLAGAIASRKKIYEQLYPSAKAGQRRAHGANRKMGRNVSDVDVPPYSKRVAELMGISQRTAQQYAAIGSAIHPDVKPIIKDHPVLNSRVFLELLRTVSRNEQVEYARRALESYEQIYDEDSGKPRKRGIVSKSPPNPIIIAYQIANEQQRNEFLNQLDKLQWPSVAAP